MSPCIVKKASPDLKATLQYQSAAKDDMLGVVDEPPNKPKEETIDQREEDASLESDS